MGGVSLKRQAVTIAETVVALLVLALVVTLWGGVASGGQRLGRINHERPLDWYLFASELESRDHRFYLRPGQAGGSLIVTSQVSGEDYQLVTGPVIYLRRVGKGGYLPLLRLQPGENFSWQQLDAQRVQFQRRRGDKHEEIVVAFEAPPRQQPAARDNHARPD